MAIFVPQRTRHARPGTRTADELPLELGHLLADFSGRVPYLFSDAAARNRVDAGDRARRLGSGADVRIARGRDPYDPTPLARADRERLCRAVPQRPPAGADVPLVFRAAGARAARYRNLAQAAARCL